MEKQDIKADAVVPIGGCMRVAKLQEILLEQMKSVMKKETLSLTANMDEEVAIGASRISYLLLKGDRLFFDAKLKGVCVFSPESEMPLFAAEPEEGSIFVTCTEEFLSMRQHHYSQLGSKELVQAKKRTSRVHG